LAWINSEIEIDAIADVDHTNIERPLGGVNCLIDGTDNFETRFLNDAVVKLGAPGSRRLPSVEGQTLTILPSETPCLRCLMPEPPPPGTSPTCDSAGILASIIGVIASLEANEALKILSGHAEVISRTWTVLDLWDNTLRQITTRRDRLPLLRPPRVRGWPASAAVTAVLCGRNSAAQFSGREVSLDQLAEKLSPAQVTRNKYSSAFPSASISLPSSPTAAVISGTEDVAERGRVREVCGN
jgi:adenylyltransferase/sulfurtransferase